MMLMKKIINEIGREIVWFDFKYIYIFFFQRKKKLMGNDIIFRM